MSGQARPFPFNPSPFIVWFSTRIIHIEALENAFVDIDKLIETKTKIAG